MFELIILVICSIVIARFLEKKYRAASVAHAILFIVLSLTYIFASDFPLFVMVGKTWIGNTYYQQLHQALRGGVMIVNISMSALFVVELVTFAIAAIVSVVALIKWIKKLSKIIRTKNSTSFFVEPFHYSNNEPKTNYINSNQGNYLVFARLLN